MKTLQNYVVDGAIVRNDTGYPVIVGNLVKLFLDTEAIPGLPEFVYGVIQHPIVKVNCDSATSYNIEYDEAELDGAIEYLRSSDVIDVQYASGGVGTVESVGLTASNIFVIGGSPITSSGTLTIALASQNQKLFLGSPVGSSGVPTFRAITGGDITNLEITHVTNLSSTITTIQNDITNLGDIINNLDSVYFPWKVTRGMETLTPGVYDWNVVGDNVYCQGGPISVANASVSGADGYIVLKTTRDASSRDVTAAVVEFQSVVPTSTASTQYRVLAKVDPVNAPYVEQRQFGEIRIHEAQFTVNTELKLIVLDMAHREFYDLPA